MKFLLDTHVLIWLYEPNRKSLPAGVRELVLDRRNEIYFSAASIWEVSIKFSRGRSDFTLDPHLLWNGARESGYRELQVSGKHAAAVAMLSNIHNDPFDRLLIAQAIIEDATLLTHDAVVAKYPGPIQFV
jgi:PIN domain nuclease of toxin-antitoxin system